MENVSSTLSISAYGDNYSADGNSTTLSEFRCGIPPYLPASVPAVVDSIQAAIVLAVAILAVLLNGTVVFLVAAFRNLHQRSFFLALQLNISHIIFATTVMVSIFVSAVTRRWLFGEALCQIIGMLHDGLIRVRFLLTLVFTLDRLLTVCAPFYYAKHGGKISAAMSAVVWIVIFIQVTLSLRGGLDCYAYLPTFKTCTAVVCSDACQANTLLFVALTYFFGGVVSFGLYLILFWKAKKLKRRIAPLEYQEQRAKHERRVRTTYLILFITLVGCTTPPFILFIIQFTITGMAPSSLLILHILVGRTTLYLLTVADPIVIMRNHSVRETLTAIKKCVQEKARSLNYGSEPQENTRISVAPRSED